MACSSRATPVEVVPFNLPTPYVPAAAYPPAAPVRSYGYFTGNYEYLPYLSLHCGSSRSHLADMQHLLVKHMLNDVFYGRLFTHCRK